MQHGSFLGESLQIGDEILVRTFPIRTRPIPWLKFLFLVTATFTVPASEIARSSRAPRLKLSHEPLITRGECWQARSLHLRLPGSAKSKC